MKTLGELLKELRGSESLRDASKRIGISHTYLDTIEKGYDKRSGKHVNPTPETLKLLSKAYNYDYKELLVKAGYLEPNSTEETKAEKDEAEFQAFANNPTLEKWYKELPKSKEEDLEKLRKMWEILKDNGEL